MEEMNESSMSGNPVYMSIDSPGESFQEKKFADQYRAAINSSVPSSFNSSVPSSFTSSSLNMWFILTIIKIQKKLMSDSEDDLSAKSESIDSDDSQII